MDETSDWSAIFFDFDSFFVGVLPDLSLSLPVEGDLSFPFDLEADDSIPTSIEPLKNRHQIMHGEIDFGLYQEFLQLLIIDEASLLLIYEAKEIFRLVSSELSSQLQN